MSRKTDRKTEWDPAPPGMRAYVCQSAGYAWQESAIALYLGRARRIRIRFKVPTLRRDGTFKADRPVQRFLTRLPLRLLLIVAAPALVTFWVIWIGIYLLLNAVVDAVGLDGAANVADSMLDIQMRRTLVVKAASPAAAAVAFGRALSTRQGHLWMVVSARNAALVRVLDSRQDVLWAATDANRPVLVSKNIQQRWTEQINVISPPPAMHWFDGSQIELTLPKGERRAKEE